MRRVITLLVGTLLAALGVPALAGTAHADNDFVVRCFYDHSLKDDPIMDPGRPGASHLHDFFGNTTTNANSTRASMLAGSTNCVVSSDTAGYWAPAAFRNDGTRIPYQHETNGDMRAYYLNNIAEGRVSTVPPDLKMIAGNPHATAPLPKAQVGWNCGASGAYTTPTVARPYDCTPYFNGNNGFCPGGCTFSTGVTLKIDFPRCWDGIATGNGHMSYATRAGCLAVNGQQWIPQVSERFHLGVMNPCYVATPCTFDTVTDAAVNLSFASLDPGGLAPYYTAHADFWNTWNQAALTGFVDKCLQPGDRTCIFL